MIDNGWIYALEKYRKESNDSGKWLIFAQADQRLTVWELIRNEVVNGSLKDLSIQAKISTIPSYNYKIKQNTYVICIYFNDSYNIPEIKEGLKEIRKIIQDGVMFYKTNNQTRANIYSGNKSKPYIYISYNKNHFDINKE